MLNDGGSTARTRVTRARPGLALAIALGVVAADQLSKLWAVRELPDAPVSIVGDTISFRLARNTGGAFSLFQAFTPLLAVVAIVVAFFLVRAVRNAEDTLNVVALSLILGGAIGNLLDRVFRSPGFMRGGVIDFVHIGAWPTFNVADSSITIGAILLVVWVFRTEKPESRKSEAHEPESHE